MLRNLSETFTATHIVALVGIAVLAPTAVFAVASFTNVAITDAKSGFTAYVDPMRHLNTYDPIAGYTDNPANLVNFSFTSYDSYSGNTVYTVPTGKVLLIKSIVYNYFDNNAGNEADLYLEDNSNDFIISFQGSDPSGFASATLAAPVIVRAGPIIQYYDDGGQSSGGVTYVQGYLIPETAVPASNSPEAAQQFKYAAKMAARRPR